MRRMIMPLVCVVGACSDEPGDGRSHNGDALSDARRTEQDNPARCPSVDEFLAQSFPVRCGEGSFDALECHSLPSAASRATSPTTSVTACKARSSATAICATAFRLVVKPTPRPPRVGRCPGIARPQSPVRAPRMFHAPRPARHSNKRRQVLDWTAPSAATARARRLASSSTSSVARAPAAASRLTASGTRIAAKARSATAAQTTRQCTATAPTTTRRAPIVASRRSARPTRTAPAVGAVHHPTNAAPASHNGPATSRFATSA